MNDRAFADSQLPITPLKNFFLGRQPVFDRKQHLFAYELLFRRGPCGPANVIDNLSATATVIAHAAELGMEKVIGQAQGLINVDAEVLLSDFVKILPRQKIILEILETVQPSPEVLAIITNLQKSGFQFALDDVIHADEATLRFLPLVDIVKIDISLLDEPKLRQLVKDMHAQGKQLVAEKVEDQAQYELCHELGFDYFQGYFFAKPVILSGRKIEASERVILQILDLLNSNADNASIEQAIKQHVSLSLNLLRLVNTPAVGCQQRIASLSQALLLLGRRQLQRWLQILLYARPGKEGLCNQALLLLASTRGKLLELIARKLFPNDRIVADTAFTVGILSLIDSLFGMPMDEILREMHVVEEISEALLQRSGVYGEMLNLAQSIEHIDDCYPLLTSALEHLHLSGEDFYLLELDAFDWADQLAHSQA